MAIEIAERFNAEGFIAAPSRDMPAGRQTAIFPDELSTLLHL
jgi:hypothetical protein